MHHRAFHALEMPISLLISSVGIIWILQLTAREIYLRKRWNEGVEGKKDEEFTRSLLNFSKDLEYKD